jgi:hypothetical protein
MMRTQISLNLGPNGQPGTYICGISNNTFLFCKVKDGRRGKILFQGKSVVCIGTRPDQLCDFSLLDPEFNRGPSVPFMRSTCKRLCDYFKFTSWVLCQSFTLLAFRGFFKL